MGVSVLRVRCCLLVVVIFAVCALVLLANAQESDFFKYKIIWNCEESGLKDCNLLLSPAYEYSIEKKEGDAPSFIVFPHDGYLTRKEIDCASLEAVTVAKYDKEQEKWRPLDEAEVIRDGGGVKIKAPIREPGIYAAIKKTAEIGFKEDLCIPLNCGEAGGFLTVPYSGKVKEGGKIALEFCGMIEGCNATRDGECSRACPEGVDPDCAGISCTPEEGDCCDLSLDGVCDPDCFKDYEHNNFGPDPDCMFSEESGADMLGNLEEVESGEVNVNVRASAGHSHWQRFSIPVNAIVEGPVKVVPNDDLWFKDFSYIDDDGEEHVLKPVCNTFEGAGKDYHVYCGEIGSKGGRSLNTWMPDHDYDADPVDYCEWGYECDYAKEIVVDYFTAHPTEWYQGGNEEKQFDFPPTYVKEFNGFVANDDTGNPSFHLVYDKYATKTEAKGKKIAEIIDPDGDGYPSQIDCQDNNSEIHPNAVEICNGYDDDCDSFTYDYSKPASYTPAHTVMLSSWKNSQFQMEDDGFIVIREANPQAYLEVRKREEHWANNKGKFVDFQTGYQDKGYPENERKGAQILLSYITDRESDNEGVVERFMRGRIYLDSYKTDFKWLYPQVIGMESEIPDLQISDISDTKYAGTPGIDLKGLSKNSLRAYNRDGREIYRLKGKDFVSLSDSGLSPEIDKSESREYGGVVIDGLKKYDQIRGTGWFGGYIKFDVYYYKPAFNRSNVDEGCVKKPKIVHVCSIPEFSQKTRNCYEGTEICSMQLGDLSGGMEGIKVGEDVAACVVDAKDIGEHKFWVWVCEEGNDCYKFLEDSYTVCQQKEVCDKSLIQDADCDGVMNFDENGEPLDSDCVGKCAYESCDTYEKKWCNKEGEWLSDDYCLICGSKDSSCAKVCEEDDKSCGGGCRQDACDVANDLWCDQGVWTSKGYAEKCAVKDAGISAQCEEGVCDADEQKTCWKGAWLSGEERFDAYCRKCANYDSLCEDKEQCKDGSCDIKNNKYCQDGKWVEDDYCLKCGAIDSDCGVKECEHGTCDSAAGKWCDHGVWKSERYCDLAVCGTDTKRCKCTEDVETSCQDGLDNDCDGLVDCADSDCPTDNCRCAEGSEIECGTSLGVCKQGVRKCVNGKYGECEGAIMPSREVCDGLDNDCDGTVDEDCGGCTPGETRACGLDRGVCNAGIQKCDEDGRWSVCFGEGYNTASEEVCDGLDNDCDGKIDEGCGCKPGENRTCGKEEGECTVGVMSCREDYTWSPCSGKQALPEVCNDGLDNDCDGLVDGKDDDCVDEGGLDNEMTRQKTENPLVGEVAEEGCETDYDCDYGESCQDGICVTKIEEEGCASDSECSEGEVCVEGGCSEAGCVSDDNCGKGEVCSSGECVKKKSSFWFYTGGIAVVIMGIAAYFFTRKKGHGSRKEKGGSFKKMYGVYMPREEGKSAGVRKMLRSKNGTKLSRFKSREEKMLEKSLKESEKLFGKK